MVTFHGNIAWPLRYGFVAVAQLTSEKAVAEAYAGELKTALEEAYEYIEQLEEERSVFHRALKPQHVCFQSEDVKIFLMCRQPESGSRPQCFYTFLKTPQLFDRRFRRISYLQAACDT